MKTYTLSFDRHVLKIEPVPDSQFRTYSVIERGPGGTWVRWPDEFASAKVAMWHIVEEFRDCGCGDQD